MRYYAKFTREKRGGWSVVFPDCPGCQTCGDTLEEANAMAQDALDGWLATHLQDGESPPRPKAKRGKAIYVGARIAMAAQLRWAREDLGQTQGELATRLGVSQQQIAKLERPDANPTLGTIEKIARALGLQVDVSMSGG